jgi:hypothetical protein
MGAKFPGYVLHPILELCSYSRTPTGDGRCRFEHAARLAESPRDGREGVAMLGERGGELVRNFV